MNILTTLRERRHRARHESAQTTPLNNPASDNTVFSRRNLLIGGGGALGIGALGLAGGVTGALWSGNASLNASPLTAGDMGVTRNKQTAYTLVARRDDTGNIDADPSSNVLMRLNNTGPDGELTLYRFGFGGSPHPLGPVFFDDWTATDVGDDMRAAITMTSQSHVQEPNSAVTFIYDRFEHENTYPVAPDGDTHEMFRIDYLGDLDFDTTTFLDRPRLPLIPNPASTRQPIGVFMTASDPYWDGDTAKTQPWSYHPNPAYSGPCKNLTFPTTPSRRDGFAGRSVIEIPRGTHEFTTVTYVPFAQNMFFNDFEDGLRTGDAARHEPFVDLTMTIQQLQRSAA